MICKYSQARNSTESDVRSLTHLQQVRVTPRPRLNVAWRHRHSNTLHRLQTKIPSECTLQFLNGWIPNSHECGFGNPGSDSAGLQSPKCFLGVPFRQIPQHLPRAVRAHPAQQSAGAWLQEPREAIRKRGEIVDAVQSSEIRKDSIEERIRRHGREVLSPQHYGMHEFSQSFLLNSASRDGDHLRRTVGRDNPHSAFCQEARVYPGAASDL